MGNFRIEIEATGGHGCCREIGDGQRVEGCQNFQYCPDCLTRLLIAQLLGAGHQVEKATFTHWPGEPTEVADDLVTCLRSGSFGTAHPPAGPETGPDVLPKAEIPPTPAEPPAPKGKGAKK